MHIVLASASPRRSQILKEAGFIFDVLKLDVDESFSPTMAVIDVPLFLARKKMEAAKKKIPNEALIITADTVVILNNEIIGKPADEIDARNILKKLSGNMHLVVSGVCLAVGGNHYALSATTKVFFEPLNESEIHYYIRHFKPFDKAGAYAIQEWIGMNKISAIEGDYYNVVGFPMSKIYPILRQYIRELPQ